MECKLDQSFQALNHVCPDGEAGLDDSLRCKRRTLLGALHLQVGGVEVAVRVVGPHTRAEAHEEVVLGGCLAKLTKKRTRLRIHVDESHAELGCELANGGRVGSKRLRESTSLPDGSRDGREKNRGGLVSFSVGDVDGEVVLVGGVGVGVDAGVARVLVVVAELDENVVAGGEMLGFNLAPEVLLVIGFGALAADR
ncbi:hypothetical protein GOP47_0009134 [Adiantum capillus-veneris]|uniref:Uncharacterized protein n=1 Tax=Adiantum capillus-veneris TaxID=13818 RepID=A0A9D4UZX4_ADICA|nr:hypothetical protein GOP47_0009134 [Adiantum capillus-veneris]